MAKFSLIGDIVAESSKWWYEWDDIHTSRSFDDVKRFIDNIPASDGRIDIDIKCNGGVVQEGMAMYDALRASGKEIHTHLVGDAASMATVIMLAAPKERRTAAPNARVLIHHPWGGEWGNYKELEAYAQDLKQLSTLFIDTYAERTGLAPEAVETLMDGNAWHTAKECIQLGFINNIVTPISASANKKGIMASKNNKDGIFAKAMAILGKMGVNPKDLVDGANSEEGPKAEMVLLDVNGNPLTLEKDSGDPAIGDLAKPDGEFTMEDGSIITVADGVITDIQVEETDDDTDDDTDDEASARVSELEAQVATLTGELEAAQNLAKTSDEIRILNKVATAGGENWLNGAKSRHTPPVNTTPPKKKAKGSRVSDEQKEADEIKAIYRKRKGLDK